MKATGSWAVVRCDAATSKQSGGDITVITLINDTATKIVHTYVEHSNNNYAVWQNIIMGFDSGYGIVIDNIRYKVKNAAVQQRYIKYHNVKEDLINADSKPNIVTVKDQLQDLIDVLEDRLV